MSNMNTERAEPRALTVEEAAQAYIDWRDKRLGQWQAVAAHDHEHGMTPCPEWDELTSEPFDKDQELDDAIRAALTARAARGEPLTAEALAEMLHDLDGTQHYVT